MIELPNLLPPSLSSDSGSTLSRKHLEYRVWYKTKEHSSAIVLLCIILLCSSEAKTKWAVSPVFC
jgi:homoserine acetyltransferase